MTTLFLRFLWPTNLITGNFRKFQPDGLQSTIVSTNGDVDNIVSTAFTQGELMKGEEMDEGNYTIRIKDLML